MNVEAQGKRLSKEIAKVGKDVAMFSGKISNEKFVANAPPRIL
nr:hypothetical protein [Desulfuromonas sp.]